MVVDLKSFTTGKKVTTVFCVQRKKIESGLKLLLMETEVTTILIHASFFKKKSCTLRDNIAISINFHEIKVCLFDLEMEGLTLLDLGFLACINPAVGGGGRLHHS